MLRRLVVVMAVAALLTAGVLHFKRHAEQQKVLTQVAADDAEVLDELHLGLDDYDTMTWVRQYRPEVSAGG